MRKLIAVVCYALSIVFARAAIWLLRKAEALEENRPHMRPVTLQLTITGGNTLKLTEQAQATVQQFDESGAIVANGSITYNASPTGIVTISDTGLITPIAPGTAIITATDHANGLSDSKTVTVEAVEVPSIPEVPSAPVAVKLVVTISEPFPKAELLAANSGDAAPVS